MDYQFSTQNSPILSEDLSHLGWQFESGFLKKHGNLAVDLLRRSAEKCFKT